jgi:hypothetical protein
VFVSPPPPLPLLNISPWIINIIPTYYGYLKKLLFFLMWAVGRSETTIEKVFFSSFRWNVTF